MICDEGYGWLGRTGKMFAFENFDVQPDIVTFAKGVTCGYVQLGGCVVSKDIAAYFDDHVLSCGLTYSVILLLVLLVVLVLITILIITFLIM